jgi:hypothetical protein
LYEPLKLSGRLGQGMDKNKGLEVIRELDVNALNFCRFSIASALSLSSNSTEGKGKGKEAEGILVVPSLLDSEHVSDLNPALRGADIVGGHLPSPHLQATSFVIQLCPHDQNPRSEFLPYRTHHVDT